VPVTWRGSTVTPMVQAQVPTDGSRPVFAIVNTFRSRCTVNVLRLVCQFDVDEAPTSNTTNRIMPIMRTRRVAAANVSGGLRIAARPAWDTAIGSADPGVEVLCDPGAFGGPDTAITIASPGGPLWQQFTARQASAVEQFQSYDNRCVPELTAGVDLVLRVGEALVIEQAARIPTGGAAWFEIAWEEDQTDAGYTVGGTVTLDGDPVSGARVLLVTDSATGMATPVVEPLTTDGSGAFSRTLASGVKAAAFVQHEDGGTQYTDEGTPFLEKP
jgi:hypothetical protein